MNALEQINKYTTRPIRSSLIELITVTDISSGDIIGKVVDINSYGTGLLLDEKIKQNDNLNMRLTRKDENGRLQCINFNANIIWTKFNGESGMIRAGVEFKQLNFMAKTRLNNLLHKYK
jgi:hypothetical protein